MMQDESTMVPLGIYHQIKVITFMRDMALLVDQKSATLVNHSILNEVQKDN